MQITLKESDAALSENGRPRLVIMEITAEDGRTVRIPYEATKTIQELYVDARKAAENPPQVFETRFTDGPARVIDDEADFDSAVEETRRQMNSRLDKIERGDYVKCVKLHERGSDASFDFKVGGIYTIMEISRVNGKVQYYEAIDEFGPEQMRYSLYPDEVELYKKKPVTVKKQVFDMTHNCGICGELNAITLNEAGTHYTGECLSCANPLSVERPQKKERT